MNQLNQLAILLLGLIWGLVISSLTLDFYLKILIINILLGYALSFIIIELLISNYKTNIDGNGNLNILSTNYNKNMRCLTISIAHNNLLEGEDLFRAIFNTFMNNEEFKNFGYNKIIILSCVTLDEKEYNLHPNIVIDNNTSFNEYFKVICDNISLKYVRLEYGYNNEGLSRFNVKVWNVDDNRNLKIKQTLNTFSYIPKITSNINNFNNKNVINRNFSSSCLINHWSSGVIKPLSLYHPNGTLKQKFTNPIFSMDIETINFNGYQIPIAISSCGINSKAKIESKIFLIDHNLLLIDKEQALKQLWIKYFTYLENIMRKDLGINNLTIFAHNLGEFDGYFIYKGLLQLYKPEIITSIIDETNSFISIKLNIGIIIEFKDSLRIFNCSLDKLCKMFSVEGKLKPYNPKYSNLDLFNNPRLLNSFKKYSLQDAIALFNAMIKAQNHYFDKFKVDIETIYSTATLSLKIFRTNFQNESIYILPKNIDLFIRNGYFGGGTDIYKAYGKKLYYYDVNSLYPAAMLKPMPNDLVVNKIINLNNRKLEKFFGFAEAKIECPLDMLRPVLPFHHEGKTIYPVGTWTGTYFSEELKAVVKLGYKITLIRGYEFTKFLPFTGYVNKFYEIKKIAQGVERDTAKFQLNNLYGYFGRKLITIITQNVHNKDLQGYLLTKIIKTITPINDEYTTILSYNNINYNILQKLNNELQINDINNIHSFVKSNVALAAAVTSYARIHMIPFKIDLNTLYTDTDSIFTTKPLDPTLLGIELGQMKDELKGQIIEEAYFIGPKQYGYYIIDSDGNRKEFSVFSGVPRNSLTFEEVKNIFEGQIITKYISNRFFKSFNKLEIDIKDTKISVKNKCNKKLVNNNYLPPQIFNGYHSIFDFLFNKFKNIMIRNFKKFYPL